MTKLLPVRLLTWLNNYFAPCQTCHVWERDYPISTPKDVPCEEWPVSRMFEGENGYRVSFEHLMLKCKNITLNPVLN